MADFNIFSLNTRGLRDVKKRREIFRWLKRYYKADQGFVMLQETHSIEKDEEIWKKEWGAEIVFSHGSNDSKGVAILFPKNFKSENINAMR